MWALELPKEASSIMADSLGFYFSMEFMQYPDYFSKYIPQNRYLNIKTPNQEKVGLFSQNV